MQIVYKKISELMPYARNNKKHPEKQLEKIVASIKEYGFKNPVLIDKNNVIIAGHCRTLAAERMGMQEVPCIDCSDLNSKQVKALRLMDNKSAELAEWDFDNIKAELEELKLEEFDIDLTGFDISDFEEEKEVKEDEFDVEEQLKKPVMSKLGDIWLLGRHRLMCGDSTDKATVEKLMNGKKADMVFTDPPYGMFLDADYSDMNSKFKGSSGGNKYENIKGDHEDFDTNLINTVFENFGYCKEIFLWGADYYSEILKNKNLGSWIVWDKRANNSEDITKDESSDKMFGSTFELCWSKNRHKRSIARVKWAGIFGLEKEHDKKRVHPTQKPLQLVKWFLDYYSVQNKNNIVDLYGGSGSTLLACQQEGKNCYLMELDEKYVDVIVSRFKEFVGETKDIKCIRNGETFTYEEIFTEV